MVMQSSNISGLVGGQMAMFSNQATYSQQIGGQFFGTPTQQTAPMSNPFPAPPEDIGSRMVGGAAMALPGMATGISMAGGIMGGTMGHLDPFTGVARGFARGVGAAGQGIGGTLGTVGGAIRAGGLRAGLGAVAGGLGGAAMAAVPYMAAGAAINTVAGNVFQGAQNVSEVGGMMNQYAGPQFGAGSRDGRTSRDTIQKITGIMHELVSQDTMRSMDSLKTLMDQAGQSGMLQGIQSAQQFKDRFSKIVKQVETVAKVMGTSLEEAMPVMQGMRQMGVWNASDIMGTSVQAQVSGPMGTRAMMGSMQMGAQMSHAMGGTMRAGAMMGQENFLNLQAAQRAGVLSDEDIMEFTGGVGGAEGQRMMAGRLTGMMSKFAQSAPGMLMSAGLSEVKDGQFTGRIDEEKLEQMRRGELSFRDIESMGRKATGSRTAKMSFFRQREKIGQNLAQQGGVDMLQQVMDKIVDKVGGSGGGAFNEEARHQVIQQVMGVGNREAELLGKLMDDMPRIMSQRENETQRALETAFRRIDERQNNSFAALKDSITHAWGETVRPLQEFGEKLSTQFGKTRDRLIDSITGRVRRIPMTTEERTRRIESGALTDTSPMNIDVMAAAGDTGDLLNMSPLQTLTEGFRTGGAGAIGRMAAGAAGGAALGSLMGPIGTVLGGAAGGAAALIAGTPTRDEAFRALGVEDPQGAERTELLTAQKSAFARAIGRVSLSSEAEKRKDEVKAGLAKVIRSKFTQLAELKKKDPEKYRQALMDAVAKEVPGFSGMSKKDQLDLMAVAQKENKLSSEVVGIDFSEMSRRAGGMGDLTPDSLRKKQQQILQELEESTRTEETITTRMGGDVFRRTVRTGEAVASATDFEAVLTGEHAGLVQKAAGGDAEALGDLKELAAAEGASPELINVVKALEKGGMGKEKIKQFSAARTLEVRGEVFGKLRSLAKSQDIQGAPEELKKFVEALRTTEDQEGFTAAIEGLMGGEGTGRGFKKFGALGRRAAQIKRLGKIGAGTKEEIEKRLKGMGLEGLEDSSRISELLEDGLQEGELEEFRKTAGGIVAAQATQDTSAKKSLNQQLLEQLNAYTAANTKFVHAVAEATGDDRLKAIRDKLVASESTKATPNAPEKD